MRFLTLAILFAMFIGVPNVRAQCMKWDCSNDPKAWADMFGTSPEQLAEQSRARAAAVAVIEAQRNANNAQLLDEMGQQQRIRLTYSLEDTLTRLAHKPATVMRATVAARGGSYVFCGSAIYSDGNQSAFVLDTRPEGRSTLNADRAAFEAANCFVGATILR